MQNKKIFYRNLDGENIELKDHQGIDEVTEFWSEIWSKPE